VDVAKRLGVQTELKPNPTIALGTQEVSPLDMATAYATIANEGRKVTPTAIEKVVRNEGQDDEEILPTGSQEEGEQVVEPEIARKATEIMTGDITQGIGWKASLGDRPVSGKSGTSENFFDSWFLGFTPQLVTGIWMGYAEGGQTLNGLLNIGGQQLGPLAPPTVIWQSYMQKVLKDKPIEKFGGIDSSQALVTGNTTTPAGGETPPNAASTGSAPPGSPPEGTPPDLSIQTGTPATG
jgi:membrane peptidoglycan carboxypeptidase